MKCNRIIGLVFFSLLLIARPLAASEDIPESWQFTLSPYLWALSVDGNTTVKGGKTKVDLGFNDVWDNLNFALMLQAEAQKGRMGLFVSPLISQLKYESDSADLTIDLNMVSFGGFYRLGPWPLAKDGNTNAPKLIVDLYAGGRYTYVKIELDDTFLNLFDGEESEDWVDPVIGVRSLWTLSPKWTVALRGDVGGFGVSSDFAWQAMGLLGYTLKFLGDEHAQAFAGYRIISQDYETGSGTNKFAWDIDLKGPVIGLAYHF